MTDPLEQTLEGTVERVSFESPDGYRVLRVSVEGRDQPVTVVGTFPPVPQGARVRIRGPMETHRRFGEQLRANSLIELAPSTMEGLERYLGSGMIKGIGPGFAKRIVETFAMDTLRILEDEPQRLREVDGLGKKRIDLLVEAWQTQRQTRDALVFLERHGISGPLATRVIKRYGTQASQVVSQEPYRLALEVWGVGFKTADRIASAAGVAADAPARLQAGGLQLLHDTLESGSVYVDKNALVDRAKQMLEQSRTDASSIERDAVVRAVDALILGGHAVADTVDGTPVVFPAWIYRVETRLAERLLALVRSNAPPLDGAQEAIKAFEADTGVVLAEEQRMAIQIAARSPVMVVTGGPGVGKTTLVRAILAVFEGAKLEVRLAAPTGRAAKRMAEATSRPASTLHRLLEFDAQRGSFRRNRSCTVDAGAVVVDETSMLDLSLADALLQALEPGTRLVLVGDVDQLPSVGPGAVLRDVIDSGVVPTVRLKRIFRQAAESRIVVNAHRINAGVFPELPEPGDQTSDFYLAYRADAKVVLKSLLDLVTQRIPKHFGLDPVRDVQVLTPMNRGQVGTHALNAALQEALNPSGVSVTQGARKYRIGDKVMQLRNDYDRGVFNGDVGFVTRMDAEEATVHVSFDGREVEYDVSELDALSLAYACTIHKAQGSEYPTVVLTLLSEHYVMLTRNLLYTAVTRGKRLVVVLTDEKAVGLALSDARRVDRRTRLAARLGSDPSCGPRVADASSP